MPRGYPPMSRLASATSLLALSSEREENMGRGGREKQRAARDFVADAPREFVVCVFRARALALAGVVIYERSFVEFADDIPPRGPGPLTGCGPQLRRSYIAPPSISTPPAPSLIRAPAVSPPLNHGRANETCSRDALRPASSSWSSLLVGELKSSRIYRELRNALSNTAFYRSITRTCLDARGPAAIFSARLSLSLSLSLSLFSAGGANLRGGEWSGISRESADH